jgi:hypothetical protein
MNQEEHALAMQAIEYEQELENRRSNLTRGRAITCGAGFSQTVEVTVRGDGDKRLWVVLTPHEVGDLIHQLAATIGCTTTIEPRNDFLSYRNWQK